MFSDYDMNIHDGSAFLFRPQGCKTDDVSDMSSPILSKSVASSFRGNFWNLFSRSDMSVAETKTSIYL